MCAGSATWGHFPAKSFDESTNGLICSESGRQVPGGPVGSRHRQQLNGEFIAALLRDFRHGGPAAIAKVRKNQPAAYCKLLTLLCPRDFRVEHSGGVKAMSDEEIERSIELIKEMLAQREAGANAKVIEGEAEVVPRLPAPGSGGTKMPKA
jgi:hypothetical protein